MNAEDLFSILAERSVKFGEFTLASGAKSDVYVDVRATSLAGDGAALIGHAFVDYLQEALPEVRAVAGLTLGADPLVTATALIAHQRGIQFDAIIVRKATKEHGTQRLVETPGRVLPGEEIVVVDDVITSGGSTLQAVHALRDAGYIVRRAICVVNREAGGVKNLRDQGIELHALFSLSDFRIEA